MTSYLHLVIIIYTRWYTYIYLLYHRTLRPGTLSSVQIVHVYHQNFILKNKSLTTKIIPISLWYVNISCTSANLYV